jgi:hypothetical protein
MSLSIAVGLEHGILSRQSQGEVREWGPYLRPDTLGGDRLFAGYYVIAPRGGKNSLKRAEKKKEKGRMLDK